MYLVTASSDDATVRLWDAAAGACLRTLLPSAAAAAPVRLAVHPRGRFACVAYAGRVGPSTVWAELLDLPDGRSAGSTAVLAGPVAAFGRCAPPSAVVWMGGSTHIGGDGGDDAAPSEAVVGVGPRLHLVRWAAIAAATAGAAPRLEARSEPLAEVIVAPRGCELPSAPRIVAAALLTGAPPTLALLVA